MYSLYLEYYPKTRQIGGFRSGVPVCSPTDRGVDPPPALLDCRKHMDIHSCAGSPIVPCALRTRLHGVVNDKNFVAGAALAKRKVVAVIIVHREGIRILDPMAARVELSYNRLNFHMGTIKFGTYQLTVHLLRNKLHSHFGAKER
jgi:hypothetical protein